MSIKVTLEFKSVDEAIVALGRLVGAPVKASIFAAPVDPAPLKAAAEAPAAPAIPRTRKPRADAGKPRGPHKPASDDATRAFTPEELKAIEDAKSQKADDTARQAVQDSRSAAPEAAARIPEGSPAVGSTGTQTPAAAVPSLEDVQVAVEALFNAKNYDVTCALLSRFGVTRGKDLLPAARADFIKRSKGVIAGEAI